VGKQKSFNITSGNNRESDYYWRAEIFIPPLSQQHQGTARGSVGFSLLSLLDNGFSRWR